MANWGNLSTKGNVEDRRSLGPLAFGSLSLTGVALIFLFNLLSGGDMGDVLSTLQEFAVQEQSVSVDEFKGEDSYEIFAETVLGSANDMWSVMFADLNKKYTPPKLVLFRNSTTSACGGAVSSIGPHYCYIDETIYLDETFFDELKNVLGAQGGDVAESYVIAHEVGHHAQNLLGILEKNGDITGEFSQDTSIKTELQADCFAGLWANSIKNVGVFEPGEIAEALDAAASVGDDRIQSQGGRQINPETWTHGSSTDRVKWFNTGFNSGILSDCNTFN